MVAEARVRRFLEERGVAPNSVANYISTWHTLMELGFAKEPPDATPEARQKLVQHLQTLVELDYAPATIRNHLAVARYHFEAHGDDGSFLAGIKPPQRIRKKLTSSLLESEVSALFKALEPAGPVAVMVFQLVLMTGMRLSELQNLQFTKDDLRAQRVIVSEPNGGKRPVFIGEAAAELLAKLNKPARRYPRGDSARTKLTRQLREAAAAAGIEASTSQLRMTYAVRMLLAGHDPEFVSKNLGLDRESLESRRRIREILVDHIKRSNQQKHVE